MHIRRSVQVVLWILSLLCGSFLASCGSQGSAISQQGNANQPANGSVAGGTSRSQTDQAVSPVIVSNPSPRQLEVLVSVTMGGYDFTTRAMTTIGLGFLSDSRPVQFVGQERLVCNGNAIPLHNRAAMFQVASAQTATLAGKVFHCTYSAGHTFAQLTLIVPQSPVIRSPQDFARLPRRANTLITYEVPDGSLAGIVALGPAAKAIAQLNTPALNQATVNTGAFAAGEGSISLTETLALRLTQTGVPFKRLQAMGTAMTMVPVTWM